MDHKHPIPLGSVLETQIFPKLGTLEAHQANRGNFVVYDLEHGKEKKITHLAPLVLGSEKSHGSPLMGRLLTTTTQTEHLHKSP
jgi:hypothetical protein